MVALLQEKKNNSVLCKDGTKSSSMEMAADISFGIQQRKNTMMIVMTIFDAFIWKTRTSNRMNKSIMKTFLWLRNNHAQSY